MLPHPDSPSVSPPPGASLGPGSPLWAWAYEAIARRAETMLDHLEGVRLGEDIEAVHDMRVGSRRLVAAMRVFAGCYPDRRYRRLLREARDVTRRLGAVRDLDVLIDHYERLEPGADAGELPGIRYFLAVQRRERERARVPMLAALDRIEASGYLGRLRRYLHWETAAYAFGLHPELRREGAPARLSFAGSAPLYLTPRLEGLYAFEQYAARPECVTELHDMRIAAKWLRYTMELFAPAYPSALKREIASVKRIQERLGDLHDSDIRIEILEGMLAAPLQARVLKAQGHLLPDAAAGGLTRLLERERQVRMDCYRRFYREWSKLEEAGFRGSLLARFHAPLAGEKPAEAGSGGGAGQNGQAGPDAGLPERTEGRTDERTIDAV